MAKHRDKDVLKNCKNHGNATKQNVIDGKRVICLACGRPVK
jgi:hypothetical protein